MGNSLDGRFQAVPVASHEEGAYFPQERRGPRMDSSIVLDADPSALAASGNFAACVITAAMRETRKRTNGNRNSFARE